MVQKKPLVSFVTLVLSHYRIPFHCRVRDILAEHGVDYRLVYSDPVGSAAAKGDTVDLPWAVKVPAKSVRLAGTELFWQNALPASDGADLTVVSQENKLLLNYILQAQYLLTGRKFAFFGHGKNFQARNPNGWKERLKKLLATRVHWWFAYTPGVKKIVENYGFPADRITVNNNTIDLASLDEELASVGDAEIAAAKKRLGIDSDNIGIYVGGMYHEKRLPFLIEAAEEIRARVPDFHLLFVGSGSHAEIAQIAAQKCDYIHFLGPCFGREKATLLKMSKAFLMPGLVGLAVLDSFAAACPLVTTKVPFHSPEIEYLEDGVNGIVVENAARASDYADAVSKIMLDKDYQQHLAEAARASSARYSIDAMAENFSAGVLKALAHGTRKAQASRIEEKMAS